MEQFENTCCACFRIEIDFLKSTKSESFTLGDGVEICVFDAFVEQFGRTLCRPDFLPNLLKICELCVYSLELCLNHKRLVKQKIAVMEKCLDKSIQDDLAAASIPSQKINMKKKNMSK
jgi:hypothetical protein